MSEFESTDSHDQRDDSAERQDGETTAKFTDHLVYGVSGSKIVDAIINIDSVEKKDDYYETRSSGQVKVFSDIRTINIFSGSSGAVTECEAILFLIILGLMLFIAIAWVAVMIVFSIVTFGGFVRRRYVTHVAVEHVNPDFLSKLSVFAIKNGGYMEYETGPPEYQDLVKQMASNYGKLTNLRQFSILLGMIWGVIEVSFKVYQMFLDPAFTYNLWPFRIAMVILFIPLIAYAPVVELRIRSTHKSGMETVDRLVNNDSKFDPSVPLFVSGSFDSPGSISESDF